MIISASRRTDVPAFYSEWFMNRIRTGFCTVPNPVRHEQVSQVSLKPEDVDVIVFWTRNPRPLMKSLKELDDRGYRFYFQYTIMGNPRILDPHCPPADEAIKTACGLAETIGPDKVIWRYDPIVFSRELNIEHHRETYRRIAEALSGSAKRSVISIVDIYRKLEKRLKALAESGFEYVSPDEEKLGGLLLSLAEIAGKNGMEIVSCAEEKDLSGYGIKPGKCIDDEYIFKVFGHEVMHKKDPSQRRACGCVSSKDIGAYDTCLFGCQYCYATSNFERARENHARHDPTGTSLVGSAA